MTALSRQTLMALALAGLAAWAVAQPAPGASGPGPGCGPGAGCPGPGAGSSPGAGPGMPGGRMMLHRRDSAGWALMSPEERAEHRSRMRSMKTYDECMAYVGEQRTKMAARAKERGLAVPAAPRRDPCARLKR